MAFYVGQKVICVNSDPEPGTCWLWDDAPIKGAIYTISAIGHTRSGRPAIQLAELKRPDAFGYLSYRFRPAVECKTDISIFTKILDDASKKQPALLSTR